MKKLKFLKGNLKKTKGGKTNMKRAIGIMALMAVLMIGMAGIVYGACSITDQTYLYSGTLFTVTESVVGRINTSVAYANISVIGCGSDFNIENGTGNNNTAGIFNFSISQGQMAPLLDTSRCTLTANIYNTSAGSYVLLSTCSAEYAYPDHTVPTCTHSQSSRETYNPKQTWTITGINASSATIKFGANPTRTMAEASDIFTWTGQLPESTYEPVRGTTSDGYNSTICDLNYVRIDAKSTIKQVGVAIAAGAEGQKAAGTKGNTAIIVVLLIAGIWYIRQKK